LKNFNSFNNMSRKPKLLCLMFWKWIEFFNVYSHSAKKLYLLYDSDSGHYNVITNIKGAMTKKYICNGWDTLYDNSHNCDKVCSLCTYTPPCKIDQTRHCDTYQTLSHWAVFWKSFESK
jgi:hypothetical protein